MNKLRAQFHVDDLKVSHKEQSVLEGFLSDLRSEFGQEDKLTENTGLVHECLGITIDYLIAGKVVFTMFDYLEDEIVEAAKDLKNSRSYYPGNDQLMKVDRTMTHQVCQQRMPNYSINMSRDYCLRVRGQGLTYKCVLHFYAHV